MASLHVSSSFPLLHHPRANSTRNAPRLPVIYHPVPTAVLRSPIRCGSSSNGRSPEPSDAVKDVDRILEEKRRADLAARIASGEFTVAQSGVLPTIISKLGPLGKFLEGAFSRIGGGTGPEIPQAKGSIAAVGEQAFFIPLYELFLTYGGIFRLNFGPKSFLIVSEPEIAKHILKDNSKGYSNVSCS